MNVPFKMVRAQTQSPVAALWLPVASTSQLLGAICELGLEPTPRVFALSRGWLIVLDVPDAKAQAAGALRMRALCANCFVPVDAVLGVALLDDEARALTANRGLLLLPAGEALEFDFSRPVPLRSLLAVNRAATKPWQALPVVPVSIDRIQSITLNFPDSADDLLGQGGAGVGGQSPRPDDASFSDKLKGQTSITAGKVLAGLGNFFGLDGITRKGAELIGKGLNSAPRLGEKLMGSQEAALRDLLRKFREGKTDDALKRAIPFGQEGKRGAVGTDDASLPFNNILYSLGNILGGSSRGAAGVWFAQEDVTAALMQEYRKAAQEAAKRGDHRRAAFILGKLLGDFRSAAAALMQGGLPQDAAQLYMQKLNDPLSAARAFEAAGEIDMAVAIYRERHEHAQAGDLLMRAGEEEAAVEEYRHAAELLEARGDFLAAGRLMLDRAKRAELALAYFEKGWKERSHANAPACGQALLEMFAGEEQPKRLLAHVTEAERLFLPDGMQSHAARFFNRLAELSARRNLESVRAELRDRALMGLAAKLRQRAGFAGGGAVAELFGAGIWSAAQVSDARVAALQAGRQLRALPVSVRDAGQSMLRLGRGQVKFVCFAQHSDQLFAGLEGGEVVALLPTEGSVQTIGCRDREVTGLAATQDGDALFVLRQGNGSCELSAILRKGIGFDVESPSAMTGDEMLLSAARFGDEYWSVSAKGELLSLRRGVAPALDLVVTHGQLNGTAAFAAAIIEPTFRRLDATLALLTLSRGDDSIGYFPSITGAESISAILGWHPGLPFAGARRAAPVSYLRTRQDEIEFCGTNSRGYVFWTRLNLTETRVENVETKLCGPRQDYHCACMLRGGRVAAVAPSRIDLFVRGGSEMLLKGSINGDFRGALAVHYARITEELLVVCEDGRMVRVPV